jgi:hypothetical protein
MTETVHICNKEIIKTNAYKYHSKWLAQWMSGG